MRRLPLALLSLLLLIRPAPAYVEAPMPLGAIVAQSVVVCTMVVTKVDKQKNLIVYRKLADVKGKHPQEEIRHNIGFGGLRPGEWQEIMNWAEVGKQAVFFHNGGASETYIGTTWYQAYPGGEWWNMSHGEPFLLRSYSGKVEKLGPAVADIVAGKEVIVPCMVDGDKEALHKKTARVQRMKTSLKIQDYNPKRDFAGWGGEDIRRLAGMPGFDRLAAVGLLGPDALAASALDFDGDGKPDVMLVGASKVILLQNGGDAFVETTLPNFTGGARAAVWADHDGDAMPDLLLATAAGPRLFTNEGKGRFRDDTRLLPKEPCYNLTAAAWLDADGDGLPDMLLANGFHGLRLYRNVRNTDGPKWTPPALGDWYAVGPFRHREGADKNRAFAFPPQADPFDPNKVYRGKREMECKWTKGDYPDGQVNGLGPFGANCSIYLHRELEAKAAAAVPVSFGGRDGVAVWLNGEKLHDEAANRPAAADQFALTLNLKPGKNRLLVKLTHGEGEGGFYFKVGGGASKPTFADVSAGWGFAGTEPKADALTVADFTGDGKPDVVYAGRLWANAGSRFEPREAGLTATARVGPAAADFDGDGHLDLFVPSADGNCRLLRNDGAGKFTAVNAGDLSKPIPGAVGAAWGDIDTDGRPDLLVCCLRGPCRAFRNTGDGTFTEATAGLGLGQRVFNTQAACWADLNADGKPDLILANEGQESAVLFGGMAGDGKRQPVTVQVPGLPVGGRLRVVAADGAAVAVPVTGADGRGGQSGLLPRLALVPGAYRLELPGRPATAFTVGGGPVTVR